MQYLTAKEIADEYQVIYFIQNTVDGCIKVGVTCNLTRRLRELRAGSSGLLIVLGAFPGNRTAETAAHHCLAKARTYGEWFKPDLAVPLLDSLALAAPKTLRETYRAIVEATECLRS